MYNGVSKRIVKSFNQSVKENKLMPIRFAYSFPEDCPLHLDGPVVSIYFKTHRMSQQFKTDQKSFKNHIKEAKKQLESMSDSKKVQAIIKPLEQLLMETSFWIYNQEGCAIFANKDETVVYRLFEPVEDLVVVSDSVYVKPLVRMNQIDLHYFIIGLSKDAFDCYEVYNETITPFMFDETINKTLKEVLGAEKTESFMTHGNYSHVSNRGTFHGHGGRKEESDIDTEKFFRYVDKTISTHITSIQPFPLVLCSLAKNQQMYRRFAKDKNLLSEGIDTSFESLTLEEMRLKGHEILKKSLTKHYKKIQQQAKSALASNRFSEQINEIISAIDDNRLERLYIQEGKTLSGVIDWENKNYIYQDNQNDVYEDLAELCILRSIPIYILPESFMPTSSNLSAIINK